MAVPSKRVPIATTLQREIYFKNACMLQWWFGKMPNTTSDDMLAPVGTTC